MQIAAPVCLENSDRKPAGFHAVRGRNLLVAVCLLFLMGCGAVLFPVAHVSMAYAQQSSEQMQLAPADQTAAEAEKPALSPAPDMPVPAHRPGLLDAVRNWFDNAAPTATPNFQGTQDALNNLGTRAREASDAAIRATQESAAKLSSLPVGGSVTGHELCTLAPNGAPDCEGAAIRLCQSKGLKGGKSADFVSAEKCSAQALLSGRKDAGSCKTETFVTRAVCQ